MPNISLLSQELSLISTFYSQHELLDRAKPVTIRAEFSKYASENGEFVLENSRYKTRMRPNVKVNTLSSIYIHNPSDSNTKPMIYRATLFFEIQPGE